MSKLRFTGERLHAEDSLFGVDLTRHRAAYAHAIGHIGDENPRRVLELGCGTGYGAAELAGTNARIFAVDRISPDPTARDDRVCYLRADVTALPLVDQSFDFVLSFQVIEHLTDPNPYLAAFARTLTDDGYALITTPNRLTSDGENPFHVHEYTASELEEQLRHHFGEVEMWGVEARDEAAAYYSARLRNIRRITRLDPFRLRHRLPRFLVDRLFALFARLVRRNIRDSQGLPDVGLEHFPVLLASESCLDLMALCRRPLRESQA